MRNANAPHEIGEAWIGTEWIPAWIDVHVDEHVGAFAVPILEKAERTIAIAETDADDRQLPGSRGGPSTSVGDPPRLRRRCSAVNDESHNGRNGDGH